MADKRQLLVGPQGVKSSNGLLNINQNKIINVANGVNASDVINKGQLDSVESTLSSGISALDLRIDSLEATVPEVIEAANVASFPTTGKVAHLYVAKDENSIYRWDETVVPATYDWTVGVGGDFADLYAALAAPSVVDGNTILVKAGTYTLATTLNINKKVKIYGEGIGATILTSAGTTTDPISLINVSVNDVILMKMTIKHLRTENTSECTAIAASGGGSPATRIDNFIIDTCRIEYIEFGATIRGSNYKVANSEIVYVGPSNATRRALGIYGNYGNCAIIGNSFQNNASSGNLRVITVISTTGINPNETNEGTLYVGYNSAGIVGTAISQFYAQENTQGVNNGFSLILYGNNSNETSAFVSLYSAANFANIFSQVTAFANTFSNNHESSTGLGKGLIGIDGPGPIGDYRSSPLPVHASLNVAGQVNFRADYAAAIGSSDAVVGYKTSVFNPVTVVQDEFVLPAPTVADTPIPEPTVLSGYVELNDLAPYLKHDGSVAMSGNLNLANFKIQNLANPTAGSQEAATASYVDTAVANAAANSGSWVKYSVTYAQLAAASASNSITLFSLAAKKLIEAVTVVPTEAFVAGGNYSIRVGVAGYLQKYATPYVVSGIVPGGAEFKNYSTSYSVENLVSATNILIEASVDAGLLSDASAGAVDIYVKIGSLPA